MAKSEVRTQIYLERRQHEALKREAKRRDVSMAQVVREAVSEYLAEPAGVQGLSSAEYRADPIWELPIGCEDFEGFGRNDAAENHDEILYGPSRAE